VSPVNEAIAYYDPGDDISCYANGAAVTGRRLVMPNAAKRVGSQALATDGLGGNIPVIHATAGKRPLGVSTYDAASGERFPVARGHKVMPVEAGAAIAAGAEVMSDATGRVVTWTSAASEANFRCGICLNAPGAAGQTAIVALDL
jgi:hypothetical protein